MLAAVFQHNLLGGKGIFLYLDIDSNYNYHKDIQRRQAYL